eukprot:ANDGO_03669.mRNA.1 Calcium-transporting ATPase PAT1
MGKDPKKQSSAETARVAALDSRAAEIFGLTNAGLSAIVNFDKRDDRTLVDHLQSIGGVPAVASKLNSNPKTGVPGNDDIELRKHALGENRVPPPPAKSFWSLVADAFEDTILRILVGGAAITFAAGMALEGPENGWKEGVAIFVAVFLVVFVTSGNDYLKEKKFQKIFLMANDKKVKVVRGGVDTQISSFDVCAGDVVLLATGDEVPADGLLIEGRNLLVDESALTGESLAVRKNDNHPFMFSGCEVTEGDGMMLATAVGVHSSGGQIQALLSAQSKEETPLQEKLSRLAIQIGKFGTVAAIATLAALMINWGVRREEGKSWDWDEIIPIVHFFVIAVTIVVLAVPEGLPLAVTISLAFSMVKMIKDRNFVRHLDASETMGETTCICTDKTGTLTENRMTVVIGYFGGNEFSVPTGNLGNFADLQQITDDLSQTAMPSAHLRHLLCESMCLNSTCFIENIESPNPVFVGSKTEGALLVFAYKMGAAYGDVRNTVNVIRVNQFSSEKKRMSVLVPRTELVSGTWSPSSPLTYSHAALTGSSSSNATEARSYVKGAAEMVLSLCTSQLQGDGSVVAIDEAKRAAVLEKITSLASRGLRTICLAYRNVKITPGMVGPGAVPFIAPTANADDKKLGTEELSVEVEKAGIEEMEKELTFIGIVGIKDPVRPEVPDAVFKCRQAGLVVRMVTGDNILTAKHIARECGILSSDGICLEGPAFRVMSDEEKDSIIPKLQVLARSSPQDKFILVSRLQKLGEVVAVTGDGTNDAPALKQADVGFSMGIAGTDIAKTASDIILLDDNFSSIVNAIRWGRNVFESIRKFVQFQLTVNIVAILITFIGSVVEGESPLSTVQLLWVNLIMDTLGALALATDAPRPDVLRTQPVRREESVVTKSMGLHVIVIALYQLFVLCFLLFYGYRFFPDGTSSSLIKIHTIVFTTFVVMQIVNEVISRNLYWELNIFKGILSNPFFIPLMFVILGVQIIVVQFGSSFTSTIPLTVDEWIGCVCISLTQLPFAWVCHLPKPPIVQVDTVRNENSEESERLFKPSNSNGTARVTPDGSFVASA